MNGFTPTPEQLKDWRSTLIDVMVTADEHQTRSDLAEMLKAILPKEN